MDLSRPDIAEIVDAVGLLGRGETVEGRARLLALWDEHSAKSAQLQMSVVAHFLADTEPKPADELEWDLRALEAATGTRLAEDRAPRSPELESFLPSLHGSVGEGYRKLGDLERARRHVGFAVARAGSLADDAYGEQVRNGLRRLQMWLGLSPTLPETTR